MKFLRYSCVGLAIILGFITIVASSSNCIPDPNTYVGTWSTGCIEDPAPPVYESDPEDSLYMEMTFTEDTVSFYWASYFNNAACVNDNGDGGEALNVLHNSSWEYVIDGSCEVGVTKDLLLTAKTSTITGATDDNNAIGWANGNNVCEYGTNYPVDDPDPWVEGVPKDIIGQECGDGFTDNPDSIDDSLFDIIRLNDDGILQIGAVAEGAAFFYLGKKARPNALNDVFVFTKK